MWPISILLIVIASLLVQSLSLEPAVQFDFRFNAWPFVFVVLFLLVLPAINSIPVQMALFFSISVISALGLAEPLTGSHAAGTSPVIFGLSFYTATLAYHAATNRLRGNRAGKALLFGSPIFIYTGPMLTRFRVTRLDLRRAYVGSSYLLLGFFMFWGVAKNIVPLLELRDLTNFWDVLIFGAVFEVFVYFNFCGLSLLIFGVSMICGLRIPLNFRQPFSARNVVEFWRSWHVALAMVLKEVFYLRLKRVATTDLSIVGVFLASAMWHGVTLNFLIWGLFHGCMFVIAKYVLKKRFMLIAFAMLPPVLVLGRALFAENRTDILLSKIASILTLDGMFQVPTDSIDKLMETPLAAASLSIGLMFILLEVFDGRRRNFARRRYTIFRRPLPIIGMVVLTCLIGQAGGGDAYAVYGQR